LYSRIPVGIKEYSCNGNTGRDSVSDSPYIPPSTCTKAVDVITLLNYLLRVLERLTTLVIYILTFLLSYVRYNITYNCVCY
jgi:hypothetical protein